MAKIGVILLNWNGLNDTAECIDSLDKSTDKLTIYVVDNDSKNNEALVLISRYPHVKVLAQKENLGFCKGNNVGLQEAISDGMEYIVILNNDTLVPANAIAKLTESFTKLSDAGAVSPLILEDPAREKVWFSRAIWDSRHAQFRLSSPGDKFDELMKQDPYPTEFACGCCLLTSAKVLNEVGLLDERYFAYYDEAEWCARLLKHGYHSYVVPASVIYHKVSRAVPSLVSTYLLTRNRLLWMNENLSFRKRLRSFPYLFKEFIWHRFHVWGLTKGNYSKQYSRALLQGRRDYFSRRFGKWRKNIEKIIFVPNNYSGN